MQSALSNTTTMMGPMLLLFSVGAIYLSFFRGRRAPTLQSDRALRRDREALLAEHRKLRDLVTALTEQVEELTANISEHKPGCPPPQAEPPRVIALEPPSLAPVEPAPANPRLRLIESPVTDKPVSQPDAEIHDELDAPIFNPRFQAIFEMANRGEPGIAIAQSVQMPLGEVELILNLRKYVA